MEDNGDSPKWLDGILGNLEKRNFKRKGNAERIVNPLVQQMCRQALVDRIMQVWDEGYIEENTAAYILGINTDELYGMSIEWKVRKGI